MRHKAAYRKPYAACRHAHSAIEAALYLKEKSGFSVGDIEDVLVETYDMAIAGHDHKTVKGIQSAKMSIPFSVALALVKGNAGLDSYSTESVFDAVILRLADKVSLVEDSEITSWFPEKRAARVTIVMKDCSFTHLVEDTKGETENPMIEGELTSRIH